MPSVNPPAIYTGTGTTASYTIPWKFVAATDLAVYQQAIAGTVAKLTLTTDYTVVGAGNPTGGTLTLTAGNLASGVILAIFNDPSEIQPNALPDGSRFFGSVIEGQLDALTRYVQAIRAMLGNSVQVPLTESLLGKTLTLPSVAQRASKYLGFDALGNVSVLTGSPPSLPSAVFYDAVKSFGADPTGTNDSTTAIQAAITAVGNLGGGTIICQAGTYKITSTLVISQPGVQLIGTNADTNHNVSFTPSGTIFTWAGSSGGTMLSAYTPNGATSPAVSNLVVKGIKFNCANLAATAIEGISLGFCTFEDINVYNPTSQGFNLYCQAQTEVTSFRRCTFKRISIRCLDGVSAPNAHGFVFNGNANGNVCFCTFEDIQVVHKNGVGVKILDGDNNLFLSTYCFRAAGGTGYGVELHGGSVANLAARANHFIHLSANGGVMAYGTVTYAAPSKKNNIWFYDRENGCPDPVLETGATLFLHDDEGSFEEIAAVKGVIGDNRTNVLNERPNIGTESVRIINGSDDHIRLVSATSGKVWRILVQDSTGDLIMLPAVAGSEAMNLGGGQDVKIKGMRFTSGTTAPAAGTWVRGDRCFNSQPAVGSPKGWICTAGGTPGTWVSEGNL